MWPLGSFPTRQNRRKPHSSTTTSQPAEASSNPRTVPLVELLGEKVLQLSLRQKAGTHDHIAISGLPEPRATTSLMEGNSLATTSQQLDTALLCLENSPMSAA